MKHTHNHESIDISRPLISDAELQRALARTLTSAEECKLWLFLLGEDHRLLDLVIPMADLPESPEALAETPDLGTVNAASMIIARFRSINEMVGGNRIVLVWERPGEEKFAPKDLAWARAMVQEAGRYGPWLRAQFLLHDGGTRLITPDDYA